MPLAELKLPGKRETERRGDKARQRERRREREPRDCNSERESELRQ